MKDYDKGSAPKQASAEFEIADRHQQYISIHNAQEFASS